MTVTARPWPSSAVTGVVLAGLASALLAFLPSQVAGAASGLVNGGFESGDLTGWTLAAAPSGGAGEVVAQYSTGDGPVYPGGGPGGRLYQPAQGLDFAVLTPGQGGTYTELSQLVSVDAGDTIHGWAFFRTTEDFSGGGGANDDAEVVIQSGGADVATPYRIDASTIGTNAHSEWTPWSYTFPAAGTYAVQGRVRNVADSLSPSYLGLDGISFGDTTAPVTTISSGPIDPTSATAASFAFAATDADDPSSALTAECRLDGATFTPCTSPATYSGLALGPHTFTVRATDPAGNTGSATTGSWTIVAGPPPSGSGLVNGGFESGDLTGWTLAAAPSGGAGEVVAQYSTGDGPVYPGGGPGGRLYQPAQGLDFAVLTPGQGGTYTELSQLVSVDAGDTIHGWAFFRTTEDFSGGGGANDDAEVVIQSGGADVATPYRIDASTIGTNAHSEWTPWSYTFPAAGTYAVQGRVRNVADSLSPSYLGLDGISFGDTTAPATSITLAPASPDGQNGWYVSNVHATAAASDNPGGSGVAETRCVLDPPNQPPATFDDVPAGCTFTGAGNDVTADGPHTLYAASQDHAGNKETPVSTSLKVDRTPPTLACTPAPTFTLGSQGGSVGATVSDATSGPAQSSISAPVNSSDTATPGVKTKSLTGYDNAGNPTTVTCPYLVAYAFTGFYAPVDNLPTVNVGNAGKTYPVKFTLSDAAGNYISSLTSVTGIQYRQVTCGAFAGDPADALETTASGGSALRYDSVTNQFIYNWQTPSGKGCYELFVHTGDGVLRQANFQLK